MDNSSGSLRVQLTWKDPESGEDKELTAPLPISIGRVSLNNISLEDTQVSRYHARLEYINDDIVIVDQNSTNGTFVGGKKELRANLVDGDTFEVGSVKFTLNVILIATDQEQVSTHKLSGFGGLDKTVMWDDNKKGTLKNPSDQTES